MLNEQNEGLDDNESNNGTARQQSGGDAARRVNREGSGAADGSQGLGGAGGAHEPSLSATIPLTPQDRQAIERVSSRVNSGCGPNHSRFSILIFVSNFFSASRSRFSRTFGFASLFRMREKREFSGQFLVIPKHG